MQTNPLKLHVGTKIGEMRWVFIRRNQFVHFIPCHADERLPRWWSETELFHRWNMNQAPITAVKEKGAL